MNKKRISTQTIQLYSFMLIYGFMLCSICWLGFRNNLATMDWLLCAILLLPLGLWSVQDILTGNLSPWGLLVNLLIVIVFALWSSQGESQQRILDSSRPIESALGISAGFIITDMLTHFSNWLCKFNNSKQGLSLVWLSAVALFISNVFNLEPLHTVLVVVVIKVATCIASFSRYKAAVSDFSDRICSLPWLGYIAIFMMITWRIATDLQGLVAIAAALFGTVALEEMLIPAIARTFGQDCTAEEQDSALGGGDAQVIATIGGLLGPIAVIQTWQFTMLVTLVFFGVGRVFSKIFKPSKPKALNGASNAKYEFFPLVPFISITACAMIALDLWNRLQHTYPQGS